MTEKLKPEQRKIWRRIYLSAFEGGATNEQSATMADIAVKQWEDRGAFDDDPQDKANSPPSITPHFHLRIRFPFHETGARPYVGEKLFYWADGSLQGTGVVVSYRIHASNELEVHAVTQGGNPNVGAEWQFEKPRTGISACGEVIGELSHTHEPRST